MSLIFILITLIYLVLIMAFIIGFDKIEVSNIQKKSPSNRFSIIIPFKDEAPHLKPLLASLEALQYPCDLYEIILINDHSKDVYKPHIQEFAKYYPHIKLRLIHLKGLTGSPKKSAITAAVKIAEFEWIVGTDADCTVSKTWLRAFDQYIESQAPVFICAPVKFKIRGSFLFHFQNLNFLSLAASTIGSFGLDQPIMCNGANLCYRKDVFFELNGFRGNMNIVSGDDVFLLEKMHRAYPDKTRYLKSVDAMVTTQSERSWLLFFNQQLRWVSKTNAYQNKFAKLVGLIVFTENLACILLGIIVSLQPKYWVLFFSLFSAKILIDFILISKSASYVKHNKSLYFYLIISILHPLFTIIIGGLSLFKSYSWKGRQF